MFPCEICDHPSGEHTCGLAMNGTAYCWGFNRDYQLGDSTYATRREPVPVSSELTFKTISAGTDHTCAVATDGAVYCWGGNDRGQIGNGSPRDGYPYARWDERSVRTPTPVVGLVERVSVETAIGVERGGYAFARSGALSFVSISAGAYYSCGISTDGGAYCWGQGEPGQLGHGSRVTMPAPIAVADWR